MSILAYSELLKRITGISEDELEKPFIILNRNNTTKYRLEMLKSLAMHEPISIGKLLKSNKLPRGGGSYITIQRYFLDLEKEGLLQKNIENKKTTWSFSDKYKELKKFILK